MKKSYMIGASVTTGVVLAASIASPALAWHPKGQIKKFVQNQTANSTLSDANTAQTAVSAKPGDTLKYVIEVSNTGAADTRGWNDMHYTVLSDTLPAGIELASNPAQRQITDNLGVIKAGQKVTKEYVVRVTATKDKDVINNQACFTGDSEVKDNKQAGCDNAIVTVKVPEVPKTPEEPKTPETPVTPPQTPAKGADQPQVLAATTLPATGPESVAAIFTGTTGLGYAAHRLFGRKRR